MSKISSVVLIVGVVMVIASFAVASGALAILTVNQTDNQLSVMAAIPSSTSSSSPTGLSNTQTLWVEFTTPTSTPYLSSPTISGATGSLTVSSSGTSPFSTSVTPSISTAIYPTQLSPEYYAVKLTLTYTFNPTSSQTNEAIQFAWSGSMTVTGQMSGQTSSTATYFSGSASYYGHYNSQILNPGQFGIAAAGYTFQYITPTSNISMSFSTLPATIDFYYVEVNGVTSGASEVYITVAGTEIVLWNQATGAGTTTTINGYTAYEVQDKLSSGTYTIDGYLLNVSNNQPVQLMSFGMSLPGISPNYGSWFYGLFTLEDGIMSYVFYAGAALIVVGGVGRFLKI